MNGRRARALGALALLPSLPVVLAGCRHDVTEVALVVQSDLAVPADVDNSFGSKIINEVLPADLKNSMVAYSTDAGRSVVGTDAWPLAVSAAAVMNRHLATFRSKSLWMPFSQFV